eukprot:jgi/Mesvir1/24041/Mv10777-RA.1
MFKAFRASEFIVNGLLNFTSNAYRKHAASFDPKALDVDLTGVSCMVTGANSGIGFATAEALAARKCSVHLVCRSRERGQSAVAEIQANTGNRNVFLRVCDISSMKQIREMVSSFEKEGLPLHVLVNNAGCMVHEKQLTEEGFEANFATNTLGTFVLTTLMVPTLRRCAPSRVITVASGGMLTEDLEVENLQGEKMSKFDGTTQYAVNKRQQVALTEKWAEMYKKDGISFFSMHPGWADTPVVQSAMPSFREKLQGKLRTAAEGADTVVWLAAMKDADKLKSGAFYFDRAEAAKHLPLVHTHYTADKVNKLYDKLLQLSGCTQP